MQKPKDFYGRKDTFVSPDAAEFGTKRYDAMQAIEAGTATAEQKKLMADCDRDMQRIIEES